MGRSHEGFRVTKPGLTANAARGNYNIRKPVVRRCDGCGGNLVENACRLCAIRAQKAGAA